MSEKNNEDAGLNDEVKQADNPAPDQDKDSGRELTVANEEVVGEEYIEPAPQNTLSVPYEQKRSFWYYIGKFFLIILQVALMISVIAGAIYMTRLMISEKPEARKRRAFKTVYTIETITAELKDRQPVFVSYGQTVAARTVDLRSLVSGEIIKVNPNLRAGAQISEGDALVEIDDFSYRGALSEAKANLQEAEARILENDAQVSLETSKLESAREQLAFAEADLERAKLLKSQGNITQKEVDSRSLIVSQRVQAVRLSQDTIKVQQSRAAQTKATLERLKWRIQQAQRNLDSTVLIAPFSGIVKSSSAEAGRAVTANDVVVSLNEADLLDVKFTLTDAQFGRLQSVDGGLIGHKVKVVWSVGGQEYTYPAEIDRVGAEITSNRGGIELFAKVGPSSNAITIRPGAFVEIHVPDKVFKQSISIPDTAIYGINTVYVAKDGKLEKRTVKIAAYEGETALVTSGVMAGDEVLTTRITEVSEGLAVRREGEAVANRGNTNSQARPAAGRPSREEVAAILKKNNITLEAWRALPVPERRKLVKAHRSPSQ